MTLKKKVKLRNFISILTWEKYSIFEDIELSFCLWSFWCAFFCRSFYRNFSFTAMTYHCRGLSPMRIKGNKKKKQKTKYTSNGFPKKFIGIFFFIDTTWKSTCESSGLFFYFDSLLYIDIFNMFTVFRCNLRWSKNQFLFFFIFFLSLIKKDKKN